MFICVEVDAQLLTDIDEYFPFQDELAPIKKGEKWGFINKKGDIEINFRDDIVVLNDNAFVRSEFINSTSYPIFSNNRCLIKKLIDGTYYYGYINEKGNEIIEPQFLNASNFKNGYALAIKLAKNSIGYNEVLKKNIVTYRLEEYIIDTEGTLFKYLYNERNYIPSKTQNSSPPIFYSKFIAPNLIAVKNKDQKWDLYDF